MGAGARSRATTLSLVTAGFVVSAVFAYLAVCLVLHAVNFFPYVVAGAVVLHTQATAVRRELA